MARPLCAVPCSKPWPATRRALPRSPSWCGVSLVPRIRRSISAAIPQRRLSRCGHTIWRFTMNSPAPKTTTPNSSLSAQLQQIGLLALPAHLDDFVAHAAQARWSPYQVLEQMAQVEIAERSRRSLERRLRLSGIKKFKPMADFDWGWPTKIERDLIERALTLDFLAEARNLVLVGRNGLG